MSGRLRTSSNHSSPSPSFKCLSYGSRKGCRTVVFIYQWDPLVRLVGDLSRWEMPRRRTERSIFCRLCLSHMPVKCSVPFNEGPFLLSAASGKVNVLFRCKKSLFRRPLEESKVKMHRARSIVPPRAVIPLRKEGLGTEYFLFGGPGVSIRDSSAARNLELGAKPSLAPRSKLQAPKLSPHPIFADGSILGTDTMEGLRSCASNLRYRAVPLKDAIVSC